MPTALAKNQALAMAAFALLLVLSSPLPMLGADAGPPTDRKQLLGVYPSSGPLVLKTGAGAFAAFRDGSKVVCANRRFAEVWDMTTGQRVQTMEHPEVILAVAISPDDKALLTVTAGRESPVRRWDLDKGKLVREYASPFAKAVPAGPIGEDRRSGWNLWDHPRIWRFVRSSCVPKTGFGFTSVAFSLTGREFATGCEDGTLIVWNTETGKETVRIRGDSARLWSPVFSPDGTRILTSSMEDAVQLWAIPAKTLVKEYQEQNRDGWVPGYRIPVAFSSDSKRFAFYGPKTQAIRVCDAKTGEVVRELPENMCANGQLALSLGGCITFLPGDNKLLSNTGWVLKVWDIDSGKVLRRHVCQSGVNAGYESPSVHFVEYLPGISAAMAVEVENDENTREVDWTVISIVPISAFGE